MKQTTVVRRMMYAQGKTRVFTNRYDMCHTVKCYMEPNVAADGTVKKSLTPSDKRLVKQLEATGAIVRTIHRDPRCAPQGVGSIIVELPL